MKPRRWLLSLFVLAAFSVASCDTLEVLDQEPSGDIPADQAFATAQNAESVLVGAYDEVQDGAFIDDGTIFAALAADQAIHSGSFPSWQAIDAHNLAPTNPEAGDQWSESYDIINVANTLIAGVPDVVGEGEDQLSQARADELIGQARVMRAYAYHNLIKWFGVRGGVGVPLVLERTGAIEDVTFPERASYSAVYDQIISDLQQAEDQAPPPGNGVGFIDTDVASALLARVLLYDRQFGAAAEKAGEFIDASGDVPQGEGYALNDAYSTTYEALNTNESIWELQYNEQDDNAMAFFAYRNGFGGRYEYAPGALIGAYDSTDVRLASNFTTQGVESVVVIDKYFRATNGDDHHYILRLPEMMLIRAEGLAKSGGDSDEALALVNRIRTRAGADSVSADEFSGNEESIILRERRLELAFEGHRWHDLVRTENAVDVLPQLSSENSTRWPIPQDDLDTNENLSQNPGY